MTKNYLKFRANIMAECDKTKIEKVVYSTTYSLVQKTDKTNGNTQGH